MIIKGTSERAIDVLKALNALSPVEFLVDGTKPEPKKKRVLLDPGHSKSEPGARSNDGTAKEEYLNLLQAEIIAKELTSAGIEAVIYNQNVDDLESIGKKAAGFDMFVSVHHNSYSGGFDPGTEVFVPRGSNPSRKAAAQAVCNAICKALNTTNRGVKEMNFTVIATAGNVIPGPVMLVESYFLNGYDLPQAEKRSIAAADAIADALISLLQ